MLSLRAFSISPESFLVRQVSFDFNHTILHLRLGAALRFKALNFRNLHLFQAYSILISGNNLFEIRFYYLQLLL